MRFPNALEGVKKIYKAEIIALIAAIAGAVATIIALLSAQSGGDGALAGLAGAGVLYIAMAVLLIIAFIINIAGLSKAKADEENFKTALMMVFAGIALSIVAGATKDGTLLNSLGNDLSNVCNLLINYYVATAILNLAMQLGNTAVAQKAKSVRTLLIIVWGIAFVLKVFGDVLMGKANLSVVALVLAVIAAVVEIVAYIIYLGLLGKTKTMLEA